MLTRRDTEPWRKDEKLRDGMSIITLPPSRVFEPKASILITLLCLCLGATQLFRPNRLPEWGIFRANAGKSLSKTRSARKATFRDVPGPIVLAHRNRWKRMGKMCNYRAKIVLPNSCVSERLFFAFFQERVKDYRAAV